MAIVKLKTWEQLKSEFGLDNEGDVCCKFNLKPEFPEHLCRG